MFDMTQLQRPGLPAAQAPFKGFPAYNFVGGHNDADHSPAGLLAKSLVARLSAEGRDLATYNLATGPQGYLPLRELVAANLNRRAGMSCSVDQILITSGSLQALDLVNTLLLQAGDTVLIEEACYGGTMTRLERLKVHYRGVPVDGDGMRMDALRTNLEALAAQGITPKFIYTIPSAQNPTGSVMPRDRRLEMLALAREFGTAIFEDDCYADLIWEGERPPAIRALDNDGRVIYCGSFSKSLAPSLRVGYLVADWPTMGQILSLKTDAGTGALEQMALAGLTPDDFDDHVEELQETLKRKCAVLMEAIAREFGTAAEFDAPKGGIFLWVTLPESVDTGRLAVAAAAEGVAINPGAEWTADGTANKHRMRVCFAHPTIDTIEEGVGKLARICHREFGVPVRSGNVAR